jgi:hypothetical protein
MLTGTPDGMAQVVGGAFQMGSDANYPEERLAHTVTVDGFWIDRYAVTNADFAARGAEKWSEASRRKQAPARSEWEAAVHQHQPQRRLSRFRWLMPLLILLLHIFLKQHDLRALTAPQPADKYKSL